MGIGRIVGLLAVSVLGLVVGVGLGTWVVPRVPALMAEMLGRTSENGSEPETEASDGREVAFWKSSMIPNFVSPRPGQDPMGMVLIPVYADEMGEEQIITVTPAVVRNMGLRTEPVVKGDAKGTIRTVGTVDFAEPLLGDVTLKVEGWVEDLMVDYVGQRVEKGQPLFSLYSPELVSAQEEYLRTLERSRTSTIRPTERQQVLPIREKLRYWDVPDSEVEALAKRGQPAKVVTFESPYEGWVVEKHALRGMHMDAGTRFYRIAGLSTVWVYVTIYEFQLPTVKVGQSVRLELPYRPGEVFAGKVIYIYPSVDARTRQVRVRLEFPNPDTELRPGMFGDVVIALGGDRSSLLVPRDSVIDVGQARLWTVSRDMWDTPTFRRGQGSSSPKKWPSAERWRAAGSRSFPVCRRASRWSFRASSSWTGNGR